MSQERANKARGGRKAKTPARRGRPTGTDRGPKLAHLPPTPFDEPEPPKLVRDDGSLDVYVMLDLFLANVPPEIISREFGADLENVRVVMKRVANETLLSIEDLLEQITLKNIARIEQLMTTWYPLAMDGDEKAHTAVLNNIKLETELRTMALKEIAARNGSDDNSANADAQASIGRIIERIETTLTKDDDLYKLAQGLHLGGQSLTDLIENLPRLAGESTHAQNQQP